MSYSPVLGRFMQRDPLGYVDGSNQYQYVGARPVASTDPQGTKPQPEIPGKWPPGNEDIWAPEKWLDIGPGKPEEEDGKVRGVPLPNPIRIERDYAIIEDCTLCAEDGLLEQGHRTVLYHRTIVISGNVAYVVRDGRKYLVYTPQMEVTDTFVGMSRCLPADGDQIA